MADSLLSGKALFVLAIMMFATYTFTGVIYPEDADSEYSQILVGFNLSPETIPLLMDFPTWIQIQYMMGYSEIINGEDVSDYPYYARHTVRLVRWHYQEDNKIFEKFGTSYNSGMAWYECDWMKGSGWVEWFSAGGSRQHWANKDYKSYLRKVSKVLEENEEIDEGKQTVLEIIWDFFGSLVSGFIALGKMLTFTNIPNTPIWMIGIMNCIFIPLWIVLVVGIAPYVAKLVEAGAKFLDALIPF